MENAGSIGTLSYKQIMMNKKTTQDEVLISGYEKSDQENKLSKGKRNNEGKNTKKMKETVESKSTEYRDNKNPSQAQFSQGNKPEKEQAATEEEVLNQDKEE